eukprot:9343259-Lingulodinium_polyedra.AAC.1
MPGTPRGSKHPRPWGGPEPRTPSTAPGPSRGRMRRRRTAGPATTKARGCGLPPGPGGHCARGQAGRPPRGRSNPGRPQAVPAAQPKRPASTRAR